MAEAEEQDKKCSCPDGDCPWCPFGGTPLCCCVDAETAAGGTS